MKRRAAPSFRIAPHSNGAKYTSSALREHYDIEDRGEENDILLSPGGQVQYFVTLHRPTMIYICVIMCDR